MIRNIRSGGKLMPVLEGDSGYMAPDSAGSATAAAAPKPSKPDSAKAAAPAPAKPPQAKAAKPDTAAAKN
jgi:hypothetical protein